MNSETKYTVILTQLEGGAVATEQLRKNLRAAEDRLREAQVPCYTGPESRQTREREVEKYRDLLRARFQKLLALWQNMMGVVAVGEHRHRTVGDRDTREQVYQQLHDIAYDIGATRDLARLTVEFDNDD